MQHRRAFTDGSVVSGVVENDLGWPLSDADEPPTTTTSTTSTTPTSTTTAATAEGTSSRKGKDKGSGVDLTHVDTVLEALFQLDRLQIENIEVRNYLQCTYNTYHDDCSIICYIWWTMIIPALLYQIIIILFFVSIILFFARTRSINN